MSSSVPAEAPPAADWHSRVVDRSLKSAAARSVDRGSALVRAAATVLERNDGDDITVQEVADEAGQSLRTLYQYFESKDDLLLALFEEAMRTYAALITDAIDDLDDPLDRLAGGLLAAVTIPAFSSAALDRGLVRVRLRLRDVQPELLGRAQSSLAGVIGGLVADADEAADLGIDGPDSATFLLMVAQAAFITTDRLGNDVGVDPPETMAVVEFCLRGLGVDVRPGWLAEVEARLKLPAGRRTI